MKEKTIALLGQPNSGKSTLFNGLTGSRTFPTKSWIYRVHIAFPLTPMKKW